MTTDLALFCATAGSNVQAPVLLSLSEALLILCFGGLLIAAYQLSRVLHRLEALERRLTDAPRTASPAQPVKAAETAPTQISPQVVAAIAAACHVAMGRPVQIVAIADGTHHKQVWSIEGRRQIFASHQVR